MGGRSVKLESPAFKLGEIQFRSALEMLDYFQKCLCTELGPPMHSLKNLFALFLGIGLAYSWHVKALIIVQSFSGIGSGAF